MIVSYIGIGSIIGGIKDLFYKPVDPDMTKQDYEAVCEQISAEQLYRSPEGYDFVSLTLRVRSKADIYEAYKGYILDYQDKELVKFMTDEVKKFLREKNALKLIIDPYIPNVSRDTDANIIEDGIDNRWVHDYLLSLGYQYNDSGAQVKWCYCLDIDGKDSKTVFNSFKSNTKNYSSFMRDNGRRVYKEGIYTGKGVITIMALAGIWSVAALTSLPG